MELNDKEESQATRDHTRINNLSLISLSRFLMKHLAPCKYIEEE